jgi:protein SCO1/2
MSSRNLVIAIVLGIALAAGMFLALRMATDAQQLETATVLPQSVDLPNFILLDQDGNPVSADVFRDHWNLVFFGFTHCPDICPLTLQTLSLAQQQLAEDDEAAVPRIVLVSVDPERDTPERLAAYIDSFEGQHIALTGELAELRKLTGALGIFFNKSGDGKDYSVDHSAVVIVIGPDGRYKALFSAPHKVENFVHDLPLLTGS